MTDEELDYARAEEAMSHAYLAGKITANDVAEVAMRAARLAREGWVPVDPDLVEARRFWAEYHNLHHLDAHGVMNGGADSGSSFQAVLAAIKRGRKLERGGK